MKPSGQTGFARLRSEIRDRTHDAFVDLVADLFGELIPNFATARRFGELDRRKVDLFQVDNAEEGFSLGVQCKGFERPFGDDQLRQCLDEVEAYSRKGEPVSQYMLLVNKRAPAAAVEAIEAALAPLVASGKVEEALFLDLNRLIGILKKLALKRLEVFARGAFESFQRQASERMTLVDFVDGAPFGGSRSGADPTAQMSMGLERFRETFPKGAFGRDVVPPRFIVTSSFGFGKTTTLLALAQRWLSHGGKPIFIPAAVLPDLAFHSGAGLVTAILDVIRPEDVEFTDATAFLLRETLRTEIAATPGWILLLDGIDESPNWRHHHKLGHLWMSSADLALPLVVSVRDEVYETRVQEFQDGGGRALRRDFFERLTLEGWTDDLILEFLDRFQARRGEPPPAFQELRDLVARSAYGTRYSDIPRRPLFLGMLAEDAWAGRRPETELHKLYGAYVRAKLRRDRYSAVAGVVVRTGPAHAQLGEAEFVEQTILAMQDIAGALLRDERDGSDGSLIGEALLKRTMRDSLDETLTFEDLQMNSLLVYAGRSPLSGERQVRFAHHSFLEWFTARWYVANPAAAGGSELSDAALAFVAQMRSSLARGEPLP